jgi:hypothetical protein
VTTIPPLRADPANDVDNYVWRLHHDLGLHVIPMKIDGKGDKKPAVTQWRRGPVDYVMTKPLDMEIWHWDRQHKAWAIICGGPRRVICVDVEALGMSEAAIANAVLDGFPVSCHRPSPRGGMHAWVEITDGDLPATQALARTKDPSDPTRPKMLAEIRGQGAYAVILGMGRGIDLPNGWAPVPMTREQFDAAVQPIRDANEYTEPPRVVRGKGSNGTRAPGDPADTGEVLFQAVVDEPEVILNLLDEGWEAVGYRYDGALNLLRPDYGVPTNAPSSANVLAGIFYCFSTSVLWATPGEGLNPGQVLTAARFKGDYHAAMLAVEGEQAVPALNDDIRAKVRTARAVRRAGQNGGAAAGASKNSSAQSPQEIEDERVERNQRALQRWERIRADEESALLRGSRVRRTAREYAKVPPPDVVMDKILAAEVNLLGGPSEAGKSLLARDWSLSVAAGVPWRGHSVTTTRQVLWIASEGTHDFSARWESQPLWNDAADRIEIIDIPISLLSPSDVAWLLDEYGDVRPGLVVFDVIYGMGMPDDNGTRDVLPVLGAMKEISKSWGAATLALGHPPLSGGRRFRGSGTWNQLAATEWHAAEGMVTCEKSKIADKSKLRWPYKPDYPGLQWQTTGQALVTAADRTALILADIAAHPNDSDKARGLRLAQSMGVQPNTARDLIRAVKKGGTL